jgi:hypothetical protein
MLEYPAIGANSDVQLEENMIFSLHPQVVDKEGKVCLYTQDTYRIGKTEGGCLADVPWKFTRTGDPQPTDSEIHDEGLCGQLRVGSLFAAHLAKADEVEVWAYDVWKEQR